MFLNIVVYNDIIYEGAFLCMNNLTFGGSRILLDSTDLCAFTQERFSMQKNVFFLRCSNIWTWMEVITTVCGVAMTNPVTAWFK